MADVLERGEKILVFAHHSVVLDAVCEVVAARRMRYTLVQQAPRRATPRNAHYLHAAPRLRFVLTACCCRFIRIDGSVSSEARASRCDTIQQDPDCLVAVLAVKAAGCGLTLTAASFVVFAELYWNPGVSSSAAVADDAWVHHAMRWLSVDCSMQELLQAEDRAHRIGQRTCVVVWYLLQPGTTDELMWPLVKDKLEFLNEANLSHESFSAAVQVDGAGGVSEPPAKLQRLA